MTSKGAQVFIDESTQRDYLVVSAVIATGDITQVRREMKDLLLPGQRSLHMKDESDRRRGQIRDQVLSAGVEVVIYSARPSNCGGHTGARDVCLQRVAADGVDRAIGRLVIDRNDSYVSRDRRSVMQGARRAGVGRVPFDYRYRTLDLRVLLKRLAEPQSVAERVRDHDGWAAGEGWVNARAELGVWA